MTDLAKPPTSRLTTFKSFEESTAEDWAKITPQISHTQNRVADHVMHLLRSLGDDVGGFPVTRLEHSLQTATRAERDGRDEEYIVCALVHDIGDTLAPFNHADVAAALVKGHVSEANHFMVAKHAIFQGYYFWDYIGLDGNAREEFRDSPYFDYTAEFCAKYDQTAFDSDYKSNPLDYYEPMVRNVFTVPE
ncbi:MAG: phosphohydrolase [Acidimicrobiales bacterium]